MMKRRDALLALLSGGTALGVIGSALRREAPAAGGAGTRGRRPVLRPFRSGVGPLTEDEKQRLWRLAEATGALWSLSDLSRGDLLGFLDLKTGSAPSYLGEYRSALEVFAAACRDHPPPQAVEAILRDPGQPAADHARQFVIAEFIALHLASGGFRQFGLTRFRGFIGEGYGVSKVQPGKPR